MSFPHPLLSSLPLFLFLLMFCCLDFFISFLVSASDFVTKSSSKPTLKSQKTRVLSVRSHLISSRTYQTVVVCSNMSFLPMSCDTYGNGSSCSTSPKGSLACNTSTCHILSGTCLRTNLKPTALMVSIGIVQSHHSPNISVLCVGSTGKIQDK